MELRILKYFLAVAREENITHAAALLHITQPTLSRQLHQLEDEIGKKLYTRSNDHIRLTKEGMLLRKRAQEIVDLEERTLQELQNSQDITGDIYFGCGESTGVHLLAQVMAGIRKHYPRIHYVMTSGDADDIAEKLDKGLVDFGLFVGKTNLQNYTYLNLPVSEVFGLLLRKDDPLAKKKTIHPADLLDRPLIFSRQTFAQGELSNWLGFPIERLTIIGQHNLSYNASIMVEDGLASALTISSIINTTGDSPLCFRPFEPAIGATLRLAWPKSAIFTPAADLFLKALKQTLTTYST